MGIISLKLLLLVDFNLPASFQEKKKNNQQQLETMANALSSVLEIQGYGATRFSFHDSGIILTCPISL